MCSLVSLSRNTVERENLANEPFNRIIETTAKFCVYEGAKLESSRVKLVSKPCLERCVITMVLALAVVSQRL